MLSVSTPPGATYSYCVERCRTKTVAEYEVSSARRRRTAPCANRAKEDIREDESNARFCPVPTVSALADWRCSRARV